MNTPHAKIQACKDRIHAHRARHAPYWYFNQVTQCLTCRQFKINGRWMYFSLPPGSTLNISHGYCPGCGKKEIEKAHTEIDQIRKEKSCTTTNRMCHHPANLRATAAIASSATHATMPASAALCPAGRTLCPRDRHGIAIKKTATIQAAGTRLCAGERPNTRKWGTRYDEPTSRSRVRVDPR